MTRIYSQLQQFFSSTLQGNSLDPKNLLTCTTTLSFDLVHGVEQKNAFRLEGNVSAVSASGVLSPNIEFYQVEKDPVACVKRENSGQKTVISSVNMRRKVLSRYAYFTTQKIQTISLLFSHTLKYFTRLPGLYSQFAWKRALGVMGNLIERHPQSKEGSMRLSISSISLLAISVSVLLILQLSQLRFMPGVLV